MKDAAELDQLISYLIDNEDSHGVILLGHSTGCQVIQSCQLILHHSDESNLDPRVGYRALLA